MTQLTRLLPAVLGVCLLGAECSAQDFPAATPLEGKTNTRRNTDVDVSVSKLGLNRGYRIERTARWSSRPSEPAFTWTSSDVIVRGRSMMVTFTVSTGDDAANTRHGMATRLSNLDPDARPAT